MGTIFEVLKLGISALLRPNMKLFRCYTDMRSIFADRFEGPVGTPQFAHAVFCNKLRFRFLPFRAFSVWAEISLFDGDRRLLIGPISGRWGDATAQPHNWPTLPLRDMEAVDISANEQPIEVNLAMKYPQDSHCYAFSNVSYGARDFRWDDFKLEGDWFHVRLVLRGENTKTEWWFRLDNDAENGEFRISPLELSRGEKKQYELTRSSEGGPAANTL